MTADRKALETAANAIRFLSVDAVQKANSGHPGMPMGMAEIAVALWRAGGGVVRHNPANPGWVNRDRVVISNGHGSMLIYSVLHLTGYDLSANDLANFRQFHSKTPGHPEVDITPGIETTTGPLGQGLANAVGMALAEKLLGETFNRPGHDIVDHRTWVLVGDGCLMEGISHEAASLAGVLKLGKLTAIYDDNGISIDGHVDGWFAEDTPGRFRAYGWHVVENVDGHDVEAVAKALAEARAVTDKPSLICTKTVIGKGSPTKEGTHHVHGAPLGDADIKAMRDALGWTWGPFEVPDVARLVFDATKTGAQDEAAWQTAFESYKAAHPDLAAEYTRRMQGDLPDGFDDLASRTFDLLEKAGTLATRKASQMALEQFALGVPEMVGGSADLTGSNLTDWAGAARINDGPKGRYLSGGVREFGLAALFNGMALHGGFIPFTGTFLMFSDYERSAIRMAALMNRRVIHVLTHDSIGLGEDGPTHQPVEHAASLRLIPNLSVWRPCDGFETAVAWAESLRKANGPSALLLSRQNLPAQGRDAAQKANVARGGYVLADRADAKAVILATGSEVALAVEAQALLDAQGVAVRVVSVPNLELFMAQTDDYRASVLPKGLPRLAVEAGHPDCWWKLVGLDGDVIGMTTFGESAPASVLFRHFGFTPEAVVARIKSLI